jgi:NADPH:quinone reductase-like Zn-dependent oxidoreductase
MKLRYKIANGSLIVLAVLIAALGLVLSHTEDCGPAPEVSVGTATMQAAVRRCYGSPDVIEIADIEKPAPEDDEVLVKIRAASVNPLDWHELRGSPYIMRLMTGLGLPDNSRMGVDYSGIVEAVGANVSKFKPGDEVFGGRNGAFAEYVTVGEDRAIALKPTNMTFEQAASVGIAGITALQALRDKGHLQSAQRVLINGASGGVGTFAVQIAKSFGAEVTAVCSTRNVELVRSIGADHVFDYKKEDYTDSGEQYDLIIDNVGNHGLLANRSVLTDDGILVMIGGAKGDWIAPLMGPIKALMLSPFVDQELALILAEFSQSDLNVLSDLMQSGAVTPVIDRTYPLHELAQAIAYSEEGHARGKIIISVPQD